MIRTPIQRSRRQTRATLLVIAVLTLASTVASIASAAPGSSGTSNDAAGPSNTIRSAIAAQLEDGAIDYSTSLLYRTYAYHGDARLPAALGDRPRGDDPILFFEIAQSWDRLPAATQDLLLPFVVRPNDSRSRYFAPGPIASSNAASSAAPRFAQGTCVDGWITKDSERFPFKVWVHCDGDYDADMDSAITMIEGFWERLVALMGPPIPDTGSTENGGDPLIDFYFVQDESDPVVRETVDFIDEQAAAHAGNGPPYEGRSASGYMVGRRASINEYYAPMVLAHEFFHILQNRFNWEIAFGYLDTPHSTDFDVLTFGEFWFVEATANWAVSYIYRDTIDAELLFGVPHAAFITGFQPRSLPLTYSPRIWSPDFMHIYGAWVYFLFLEQRKGPEAIRQYWDAIGQIDVDNFDATVVALDAILPFDENFRDFAVQNLNLRLPGDPISPSYRDIDQTFAEGYPPVFHNSTGMTETINTGNVDDPGIVNDVSLPTLTAHYYTYDVEDQADQVALDFSNLAPSEALDIDLIVKLRDGDWERRQFDARDEIIFCRDSADQDIESFYLILSNHDFEQSTTVRGTFSVKAVDTPCA